jgi:DnaJ-class molecular chaperone
MTTNRTDFYAVLGLLSDASQDQISRAYRALLRQHHPDTRAAGDRSQDAASDATLQQVITAYTILHDPARRANYDQQHATGSPPRSGKVGRSSCHEPAPSTTHPFAPDQSAGTVRQDGKRQPATSPCSASTVASLHASL